MAVRGLGCPVRFHITAGQAGDAPQVMALIEGMPASVVMANTAYDSDRLRQAIADKGATAVIPSNPSRPASTRSTSSSTLSATSSNAASPSSSSSDASPPASKKPHATISPSSLSPQPSYGCDKCPQNLERDGVSLNRLGYLSGSRSDSPCWPGWRSAWMAKPYSMDQRERVVAAVEREGMSRHEAAARYGVAASSAIEWVRGFRDTGSVAPAQIGGYKPRTLRGEHHDWLLERASRDFTLRGLASWRSGA